MTTSNLKQMQVVLYPESTTTTTPPSHHRALSDIIPFFHILYNIGAWESLTCLNITVNRTGEKVYSFTEMMMELALIQRNARTTKFVTRGERKAFPFRHPSHLKTLLMRIEHKVNTHDVMAGLLMQTTFFS